MRSNNIKGDVLSAAMNEMRNRLSKLVLSSNSDDPGSNTTTVRSQCEAILLNLLRTPSFSSQYVVYNTWDIVKSNLSASGNLAEVMTGCYNFVARLKNDSGDFRPVGIIQGNSNSGCGARESTNRVPHESLSEGELRLGWLALAEEAGRKNFLN